ncbi:hypothetical protein PPACK8108_LOCUS24957 [Phakopsora pachyrhizi]|uniref:Uncharacterized protein n=1 Tax=Phakopsora pachyrhizi TaxID=170000 RepID=A0AAV0BSL7_PHAPC|nr:hypothetical protein PPACK8108_LOCUS24957 [Phakopsora pachyrhizi]
MHSKIIKDKGKIKEPISSLDKYKLEALTKAWQTVNGNLCELQPAEGMSLSQGLEVIVRLGSIWKSSMAEFGGVQSLAKKRYIYIYIFNCSTDSEKANCCLNLDH